MVGGEKSWGQWRALKTCRQVNTIWGIGLLNKNKEKNNGAKTNNEKHVALCFSVGRISSFFFSLFDFKTTLLPCPLALVHEMLGDYRGSEWWQWWLRNAMRMVMKGLEEATYTSWLGWSEEGWLLAASPSPSLVCGVDGSDIESADVMMGRRGRGHTSMGIPSFILPVNA